MIEKHVQVIKKKMYSTLYVTSLGRSKHTPHLRIPLHSFISSSSFRTVVSSVSEVSSITSFFTSSYCSSSRRLSLLKKSKANKQISRDSGIARLTCNRSLTSRAPVTLSAQISFAEFARILSQRIQRRTEAT